MAQPWIPTKREIPGIALAGVLGLLAYGLGQALKEHTHFVSDVVLAICIGALVLNSPLSRVLGIASPEERDTDAYERGVRFTGKWLLRLAIILMGLKIQTDLFNVDQLFVLGAILICALPTAFFLTHVAARALGLRQEMADLLSIGTMVCGASAINALSPVIYARRQDQGIAITAVFLFSVVALLAFYPAAEALGLSEEFGGLWAGLAVNDLSSSVAVGTQFGGSGEVIAAASKSVRIILLGPLLVIFSLLRKTTPGEEPGTEKPSLWSHFPKFILGYFLFFGLRVAGDALWGVPAESAGAAGNGWTDVLVANNVVVKLLILAVCAGIGLQIRVSTIIDLGWRAVLAGGSASLAMAGLSLAMLVAFFHEESGLALTMGGIALVSAFGLYWFTASGEAAHRPLVKRLEHGSPLSMNEAVALLESLDERDALTQERVEQILEQLYPAIGELQPLRTSELIPPIQYRRLIYWVSSKGNGSLVGVLWAPGAVAHIHSHGYDGLGKTIEGHTEGTYFDRVGEGRLKFTERVVSYPRSKLAFKAHETIHAVRNLTDRDAIHVHFYGPESSGPGMRYEPEHSTPLSSLAAGDELEVRMAADVLPELRLSDPYRIAAEEENREDA